MEEQSYFPLRWESTGDQWWYASPVDWAAANGHYDIVRELLHLDPNLLIKLTSLRRIRRLETVWDDDARFMDAARCRAFIAKSLLLECEGKNNENTLVRAGYGGWLLYTAASAGDKAFVQELLGRDALLVFGEGEYGVTDMFYAAARGKNDKVFRLLLDFAMRPRCSTSCRAGEVMDGSGDNGASVFRSELVSRAVHAAARGGSVKILRELVEGCSNVLEYTDVHGSTVLHSASGRGQLEVVKYLVACFGIINSRDNQGNTALHVAAFRGHLLVVEALIVASPSSISSVNNAGDTFLHVAVAAFRTPGFRRLDRQMELMRHLICERIADIQEIINLRNIEGHTVLHMAVVGNVHPDLVELLMTVPSIDLNVQDANGMTPLALLRQEPRSATFDILMKQLISAGGVSNSRGFMARSVIASQIKMQGFGISPGTVFKISDAEIFLYSGADIVESRRPSSCSSASKCEPAPLGANGENHGPSAKRMSSANRAAERLKILLRWPRYKEKMSKTPKKSGENSPLDSFERLGQHIGETPAPLRETFSKTTSLNNKRTLAVRSSMPSSGTKKKLNARLLHGIIEAMPHLATPTQSPSNSFLSSSMLTPPSVKQKGICKENETTGDPSCSNSSLNDDDTMGNAPRKYGCANGKYFCFGAQGLTVEEPVSGQQSSRMFKQPCLSMS